MSIRKMFTRSPRCLLALLGFVLFTSSVTAQVFDSGPSDAALFDNVITLPADPNIGDEQSVGDDGLTTQLNISRGGSIGFLFDANSGSEINISGGTVGIFADARSGSEVNISGGAVGEGFRAFSGSAVNISGGSIGENFRAFGNSMVNLRGSEFVLDGVSLDDGLTIDEAFTIDDRDVILSGVLADGSTFSFELNSVFDPSIDEDFFHLNAVLTVTRVSPAPPLITHVPIFTFDANNFATSVSGAGDVNGDGFDDLIVGASRGDNNGFASGSAQVFSGSDGSVLYTFDGDSSGDQFGNSVSGAGDVNGDGFADLIVGATLDDNNGDNSGSARVFSGSDGSVLYTFDGDSVSSFFGASVSGAGDVNGDGFADLIVGALAGDVRVFSGADGSVLYNFDGRSVSGAGDVNGDGFADLIVGAFGGSARVFSGSDGSVLYNLDVSSDGLTSDISVSDAGDVNGDGFADLIVGIAGRDFFQGLVSGNARVFSGADGSVLYNFDGDSPSDFFGVSVSGVGDVNGDGFVDLIVGASLDDDNGSNSGSARVFSGSDGSVLSNLDGDSFNDFFGDSVSGAGDVNGDGVTDFIVGASSGGPNGDGYARVFVSQIAVILGDCDQDGDVDFEDIAPFIEVLASGSFLAQADCNQDGEVTFEDIAPFIEILAGS